MAEIDDEEFAQLTQLRQTFGAILANPKAKRDFERAVKVINPEIETEDDREQMAMELAKPHIAKVEELAGKIEARFAAEDERRAKIEQAEQERAFDASFNRLKADGWTDDGLERIKKTMIDTKTADPEVAARYLASLEPPAQVRTWESARYKPTADVTDLKRLWEDPAGWCDDEVANVLHEVRSAR